MLGQHIKCQRKILWRGNDERAVYTISQEANDNIDKLYQNILSAYSRPS